MPLFSRILSTQVNINETHLSKSEKVSSLDLLLEQSDRKITRNQKRKHDEINHVQKVNLPHQIKFLPYIIATILTDLCRNGSNNCCARKRT